MSFCHTARSLDENKDITFEFISVLQVKKLCEVHQITSENKIFLYNQEIKISKSINLALLE